MKQFIVMISENMSPLGIYEAEAVNDGAIVSDKETMHVELPVEGWTGQPFEVIVDGSGNKVLQYI